MITIEEFINLYNEAESKKHVYLDIKNNHGRTLKLSTDNGLFDNFKESKTYKEYKDSEVKSFSIDDDPIRMYGFSGNPVLKTIITLYI